MDLLTILIQEAMTKDGFVIYKSFYAPIQNLSDEALGKLFRAIFEYQINGVCVDLPMDLMMAFNFFKTKFESDNEKYEAIVERNKANGKKGGRPPKEEAGRYNPENPVGLEEPKKADKDRIGLDKDIEISNKEKEDKYSKKKKALFNVREDLSYVEQKYIEIWKEWLDYKDEIRKQYKTQRGAITQYNSLIKYANDNPTLANAIVKTSIEHSWDGLFALNEKQIDLFLSPKSPYGIIDQQEDDGNLVINGQRYR